MKKLGTKITDANGGMDCPVNYRKAINMLTTHPYKNARLYHLVVTGSNNRDDYRWAIDAICRKLRAEGMPVMWKACYELDEQKRFHAHFFLLIESVDKVPCSIIRYRVDGWLVSKLAERKLGFTIAPPLDAMHRVGGKEVNYAHVPKKAGPKLDDCLVWISYLYKVRSKAGVVGQTYTSSTNRGTVKVKPSASSLPAPTMTNTNPEPHGPVHLPPP